MFVQHFQLEFNATFRVAGQFLCRVHHNQSGTVGFEHDDRNGTVQHPPGNVRGECGCREELLFRFGHREHNGHERAIRECQRFAIFIQLHSQEHGSDYSHGTERRDSSLGSERYLHADYAYRKQGDAVGYYRLQGDCNVEL